jgi:hypothetical protein
MVENSFEQEYEHSLDEISNDHEEDFQLIHIVTKIIEVSYLLLLLNNMIHRMKYDLIDYVACNQVQ